LLTATLLGSLDPTWDRASNVVLQETFQTAEQGLLSDDDETPELLVGMYDLPWRRRKGIDVVPLPGLYVKVGGICTRDIHWKEILSGRDEQLPHVLLIEGDIGERLLAGPANYPSSKRIKDRVHVSDPQETVIKKIKSHLQIGDNQLSDFLFVADGPFVSAIRDALKADELDLKEIQGAEWVPKYRFGFAIRSDAPDFKDLVHEAISEDLLGRVFPRTAHLYIKLLTSDLTSQIVLDIDELNVHPAGDMKFIKILHEHYENSYSVRSNATSNPLDKVKQFLKLKTTAPHSAEDLVDRYRGWTASWHPLGEAV